MEDMEVEAEVVQVKIMMTTSSRSVETYSVVTYWISSEMIGEHLGTEGMEAKEDLAQGQVAEVERVEWPRTQKRQVVERVQMLQKWEQQARMVVHRQIKVDNLLGYSQMKYRK